MKLKPYPEYKESGVPWLGKMPNHWNMRKFRSILSPISERSKPDLPLLSVVREKGVIKRDITTKDENRNYIPDDLSNYKVVRVGQFAMNKMKAWQGSYGTSMFDGIVSPAYYVFRLHGVLSDFFHRAIRSKVYIPFFTRASDGIRVGQWDLSLTRMKEIPFWIPTETEQTQISRFLDYKSSQIARFIRAKKRMIELLKEQKQAIINDAVTGKIDVRTGRPYPKYKPSGVEWLGDVPVDWETTPVKRITSFNPSKTETGYNSQSNEFVVFLPMENISTDGVINCSIRKPYREICNGFSYFRRGDVVAAKITPCFENGKGAFLETLETEYGFGTTELITIRPGNKINGKYLRLLLSSKWFLKIAEKHMSGSAGQKRISTDFIKNLYIGLPDTDEQEKIMQCIQKELKVLDLVISRTEREISLMQEYRTRLIADVVTGKVDVRDINVPEVAGEDLIVEDVRETEAFDEMIEDS